MSCTWNMAGTPGQRSTSPTWTPRSVSAACVAAASGVRKRMPVTTPAGVSLLAATSATPTAAPAGTTTIQRLLEAERFGVEPERPVLVGDRDADQADLADIGLGAFGHDQSPWDAAPGR